MNGREQIAAKVLETGGGLRVRGTLNPVLWLYGLTSSSMIGGAYLIPQYAILFIIALLSVLSVAVLSFIYLLFKSPDRLQSEEYQIRKRTMEIMQEKGHPPMLDVSSTSVSTNPEIADQTGGFIGE